MVSVEEDKAEKRVLKSNMRKGSNGAKAYKRKKAILMVSNKAIKLFRELMLFYQVEAMAPRLLQ